MFKILSQSGSLKTMSMSAQFLFCHKPVILLATWRVLLSVAVSGLGLAIFRLPNCEHEH
ncbi:hypothetical protein [Kingella oralis]|uniref:hypothetical protein n=1 Tax=Kingella oralis TaxID=505 RepID=UPI0034E427F5